MMLPENVQGIKATFALICKGSHQNTLIKKSNPLIEDTFHKWRS